MKWSLLIIVILIYAPHSWSQNASRGPKDGWSVGLFSLYRSQPYIGMKSEIRAFPLITYRNGGFFVRGPFIGYDSRFGDNLTVTTSLIPNLFGGPFDPSLSDKLEDMDEREGSVEGAIALRYKIKFININLGHRRDILGVYNGANTSIAIGSGIPLSVFFKSLPFTLLRFAVGKRIVDANENFYRFGVERDEVTSEREYYNPGETVNDFYTFFFLMQITKSWNLSLSYQKEFFQSEIYKSPLLNQRFIERVFLSLAYTF